MKSQRLDMLWSAILAAGFWLWLSRFNGYAIVDRVLANNRAQLYAAITSVFGSLLGFVISSLSVVLVFINEPRLAILKSHYRAIADVFKGNLRSLSVSTSLSMTALVVDRDSQPSHSAFILATWAAVFALIRFGRCLNLFELLVEASASPNMETPGAAHPPEKSAT